MNLLSFARRPAVLSGLLVAALYLSPAAAENVPLLRPADYAAATTRQDIVPGAYELVHAPGLGAVFVASVSALEPEGGGAIYMLDDADLRLIRRIQLQRGAFALSYDPLRQRLFAGNTLDGSVTVVDARSGIVEGIIQLGQKGDSGRAEHVRMAELSDDGSRLFVSSPGRKGLVWVVDTDTGGILHRNEDTGLWSAGLGFDPKSGQVYASGGGIEEIAVINPVTGIRSGGISTGDTTDPDPSASQHFLVNLSFDPDAGRIYAADASRGEVIVFDAGKGEIIARIAAGKGLLDVLFNPVRQEIYATWRGVGEGDTAGNGGVTVIDAGRNEVKAKLEIPVHPNSLALGGDGDVLYLTVKTPLDEKHEAWREGALDSVIRFDLTKLPASWE
ncbi:hypothetical protein HYQ43_11255 [Paracoccus pantotrophus]|uniref:Uncharacterized protein n=1 Tax=Paracoccus pantotrophus TaxID=82367 RepID=A0A7H9BVQ0_PARPN|nr:hypothetical protein [Paracoccus pantotrophus]QLH14856.1 hypothetical protein HYQ43_11255 [Paracoccus pantotrophus]